MAAAGAGRFSSLWRGEFVDGDDAPGLLSPENIVLSAPVDSGSALIYRAFGTPDSGGSAPAQQADAPSSFLVQFAADTTMADKAAALAAVGGRITETVRSGGGPTGDLVRIEANGQSADAVIGTLSGAAGVGFAEVNWQLGVQVTSNDAYYANGSLWGMYGDKTSPTNAFGSRAGEAWAAGYTGKSTIVVGDVDTGIDYTHRDLYLNVWLNQGELPKGMALVDTDKDGLITFRDLNQSANARFVADINGNGYIDAGDLLRDTRWADRADGDGNGYADDLIGWDFANNDNDPYDDAGHGTHTAGTIGAMGGNGTGVAGVDWNVQIMALKFLGKSGSGSLSNAVKALDYYTAASVNDQTHGWTSEFIGTNNSWGGGYSSALLAAIVRGAKQDALFIAAAGNGGSDGKGDDNDSVANYPSNYSTVSGAGYEAVVSVAALTSTGTLASYSNYGVQSVDLGAPGSGVWSTVPGGGYASYSGTSMATPHVTGALALYASLHPDFDAEQLRDALLSSTDATSSLAGKTVTGGRLDIGNLMATTETLSAATSGRALYGTTANDTVVGTNYGDTLSGIPATGSNLGKGTIDVLYGRTGADVFVLGDGRGAFYEDGDAATAGGGDYGLIADFANGDKVQLANGNYFLVTTTLNGITGTGIYRDTDGRFDGTDELVGIVKDILPHWLTNADFVWV